MSKKEEAKAVRWITEENEWVDEVAKQQLMQDYCIRIRTYVLDICFLSIFFQFSLCEQAQSKWSRLY
jgi:hypothetical protein